ncbi:MAG: two-component sensor histidine kinase [Polyangiaceae bacterium]|nr:two-component sensor histidine kinase [Polyangiaceae bacterium]
MKTRGVKKSAAKKAKRSAKKIGSLTTSATRGIAAAPRKKMSSRLSTKILEGMQEGVLLLGRKGDVKVSNRALREMLNWPEAPEGRSIRDLVVHAPLLRFLLDAPAVEAGRQQEFEFVGLGEKRILVRVLPWEKKKKMVVLVDVTDLRRLESMRRDFVANVSHELRTPVAVVRSAAESLRSRALEDPDKSVAKRFVDIIERNSERLQGLIEDLLELSKLDSKEVRLRNEVIALEDVSSHLGVLFVEKAEKKGVEFRLRFPKHATLVNDHRALEQVLSNLIDNAIKYCPSGSKVTARAERRETEGPSGWTFTVSDTGQGIEQEHLPRLFERFYRIDRGRSRELGGTGLGLSIVKHLVELMGGSVTVTSKIGKGTQFVVEVPDRADRSSTVLAAG